MSRLSFAVVLAATLSLTGPARVRADEIALFDYHGDKTQFDVLVGMLDQRVANLDIQVNGGSRMTPADQAQLSNFKIALHGADTLANPGEALRWIKSQGNVLGVLQGTILPPDANSQRAVFSQFTVPEQIPNYDKQVIFIKTNISADDFANNRDSHTLMILYCLLQDARRRKLSSAYIAALATAATNMLDDISRRSNKSLTADMQAIKADIASSLTNPGP